MTDGVGVCGNTEPIAETTYGTEKGVSPSEAVIDAVAEAANVDPMELPPLYEFVDADAIDRLFEHHDGVDKAGTELRFTVESWDVCVKADGAVRVNVMQHSR